MKKQKVLVKVNEAKENIMQDTKTWIEKKIIELEGIVHDYEHSCETAQKLVNKEWYAEQLKSLKMTRKILELIKQEDYDRD